MKKKYLAVLGLALIAAAIPFSLKESPKSSIKEVSRSYLQTAPSNVYEGDFAIGKENLKYRLALPITATPLNKAATPESQFVSFAAKEDPSTLYSLALVLPGETALDAQEQMLAYLEHEALAKQQVVAIEPLEQKSAQFGDHPAVYTAWEVSLQDASKQQIHLCVVDYGAFQAVFGFEQSSLSEPQGGLEKAAALAQSFQVLPAE